MKFLLKNILVTMNPPMNSGVVLLKIYFGRLSLRIMIADFFSVDSSIGFVSIPAFLAGLTFILLPQGRDTLLLVVEKIIDVDYLPLFFLLASLVLYSGFAELGVRYAIYIPDNSGKNLTDHRVLYRKTWQKLLAAFFLIWPYIIILIGFVICFLKQVF